MNTMSRGSILIVPSRSKEKKLYALHRDVSNFHRIGGIKP
jgi:hypothetical protein